LSITALTMFEAMIRSTDFRFSSRKKHIIFTTINPIKAFEGRKMKNVAQ